MEIFLQYMVDILVKVIGGDKMGLLLLENAALIQAVQPDVAGDVLVREKAADAERTANFILLPFGETELCLECLQQVSHLLQSASCTYVTHKADKKIHEVY